MKPNDLIAATGPGRLEHGEFVRLYTAGTLSISVDLAKRWPVERPFARPHYSATTQTIWLQPLAEQDRTAAKISRDRSKHYLSACIGYALNQWRVPKIKRQCPAHWEDGWLCIELGRSEELAPRRIQPREPEQKPTPDVPRPATPMPKTSHTLLPQTDQSYIAPPPVNPPRPTIVNNKSSIVNPMGKCQSCYWHEQHGNEYEETEWICCNEASPRRYQVTGMAESCTEFQPRAPDAAPQTAVAGTRKGGNHMADMAYAKCPECDRKVMVVKGGTYRRHVSRPGKTCPASGSKATGEK
jgi:hypothetical protein